MSTNDPVHPPVQSWIAAIHRTEYDTDPIGGGIVVDPRRIITCAHLVRPAEDTRTGDLWVAFPAEGGAPYARRLVESVIMDDDSQRINDIAILLLGRPVPDGVTPAALRFPQSAYLVERKWWSFGFPHGDPLGNSADGVVGASLAYGWVRLDAQSRYRVESGFSGSALWSPDYRAVVGVVGQSHGNGDGRAITLHKANSLFPGQDLRVLANWSAVTAGEIALTAWGWRRELRGGQGGAGHPQHGSTAVSADATRGYIFRGRRTALTKIVHWLDRAQPDHQVLVVTGSAGAGKSAVLGRIVITADRDVSALLPPADDGIRASAGSVNCAVYAKGKTALEVAIEIARAASARLPNSLGDLAPSLRDALQDLDYRRFNIVIDAVDEAASPKEARALMGGLVFPLAQECSQLGVQVIVGSQSSDDAGDLISLFGNTQAVIDLDNPEYFDEDDLARYAQTCLELQDGRESVNLYSDSPNAAPMAAKIAELSGSNFLVAGLVARSHALGDDQPADPRQLRFTATVYSALAIYLERVSGIGNLRGEEALTALAFADAPGLPVGLWRLIIQRLYGINVSVDDLSRFARSPAVSFLVETGTSGDEPTFRLFHHALSGALLSKRGRFVPRRDDERAIAMILIELGRGKSWTDIPAYLLRSLSHHAAAGGVIDELLVEDAYLLHADLRRLMAVTQEAKSDRALERVRLLELTMRAIDTDPEQRAALFSVTEALEGFGSTYRSAQWNAPYRARWAATTHRSERAVLVTDQSEVHALCAVALSGAVHLLASAGLDMTLCLSGPATGERHAVLRGHTRRVRALCAIALPGGGSALASGGDDQTVRLWDPATGEERAVLRGHTCAVRALCAVPLPGGGSVLASGGDNAVRLWDPAAGGERAVLTGHAGPVRALCAIALPDGGSALASGGDDHTVRLWDPVSGEQAVLTGHAGPVRALCPVPLPGGGSVLASGGDDQTVRLWDPVTGREAVLTGHTGPVRALCAVPLPGGGSVLASGGDDQTVRLWDPVTGQAQAVLTGHTRSVRALCAVPLPGGASALASGGTDFGGGTIRLWDAVPEEQRGALADEQAITAICAIPLLGGGTALASLGGPDRTTIQLRDAATGERSAVLTGHTVEVDAIRAVPLPESVLLASSASSADSLPPIPAGASKTRVILTALASSPLSPTVRLWDPSTGKQLDAVRTPRSLRDAVAVQVPGGPTLFAARGMRTVKLWDAVTGEERAVFKATKNAPKMTSAICAVPVSGGVPMLASVRLPLPGVGTVIANSRGYRRDGPEHVVISPRAVVELWDPVTGQQRGVLTTEQSAVHEMCAALLPDGTTLLAIVGIDLAAEPNAPRGESTGRPDGGRGKRYKNRDFFDYFHYDLSDSVELWDPVMGKRCAVLKSISTIDERGFCFVPLASGAVLLAGGGGRIVQIWDPVTATALFNVPTHHEILALDSFENSLVILLSAGILVIEFLEQLSSRA